VQFTDPTSGANFAYVGQRTTGTAIGHFLLCEPQWAGDTPEGMTRIDVPHRATLLIGRVFVADEDDHGAAYMHSRSRSSSHHQNSSANVSPADQRDELHRLLSVPETIAVRLTSS
jgi:hypothetical protein